jgi:hypothetical protein
MAQGLEEAKAALTKANDEYVMYYNCWPVFAPGDKVWLDRSNIATNHHPSYLIDNSGHLQLKPVSDMEPTALLCHPTSNIYILYSLLSKLSLALPDPILGCQHDPPPPPTLKIYRASSQVCGEQERNC